MKISATIRMLAIIIACFLLASAAILLYAHISLKNAIEEESAAHALAKHALRVNLLTLEYLDTPAFRARIARQMLDCYASMELVISGLPERTRSDVMNKQAVSRAHANHTTLTQAFMEEIRNEGSAAQPFTAERSRRATQRIESSTQALVDSAHVVAANAKKDRQNTVFAVSALLVSVGICFFTAAGVTLGVVQKKIFIPIQKLQESAGIVAQGDLNNEILIESDDEIGDLARAFRTMMEAIRANQTKLEKHKNELEKTVEERTYELRERAKELGCLYSIADAVNYRESIEGLFADTVNAILGAWQHPETAQARVVLDGAEFASPRFSSSAWFLRSPINVEAQSRGFVEVCYREKPADNGAGIFLTEERALLDRIAATLGNAVAAKEAQDELASIFNNSMDLICIAELATNTFSKVNPAFTKILGYSQDELVGKDFLEFIHPDDIGSTREVVEKELKRGVRVMNFQNRYRCKEGGVRWLSWVSIPDRTKGLIFAIARDVTNDKESAARLDASMAELKRSNEDLEQFAYVASHDLQEPLRAISSYTQLLERRYADAFDEKGTKFLRYVVDGASRMQALISDLLKYSRTNTRGMDLTYTDPHEALNAALAALRRNIEETGAIITSDDMPAVLSERMQLAQLFQNLIANSIKFARNGVPPTVHVSAKISDGDCIFTVADNGIGFEEEFKERIFAIFQRLHTRTAYEGTGIGLAICRKIVERHGGRIWVESKPGEGTTFFFRLKPASSKEEKE